MDLFEKIRLIIETQGYIPFDIGNTKELFTGLFLTPNNALILHLTSLENPKDHSPILPENASTIDARFSPDDSWIAVPVDYTGKEESTLCRLSTTHPERPIPVEQLSKTVGRHLGFDWSPDGKRIAWGFSKKKKNHVVLQPNKAEANEHSLWEGDEIISFIHWKHPDFLKFTRIDGKTNEFDEIIMDPNSGEIVQTVPIVSSFTFDGLWHPQKPAIPFLNREDGKLTILNVDSGEKIALPQPDGEIEKAVWGTDEKTLYLSATKDARDKVYSIDLDSLELNPLPLPQGINKIAKIRKIDDREVLFFVHADATTRMNLWKFAFESGDIQQLTKKRSPKIGTDEFPLVNSISEHWSSRDGLKIHGFVMVPQSPPPAEGYPAIVFAHGGPMGQDVDSFVGTYQILVQEGFVVFRPNFRGSTGYGAAFQRANYREIGKKDLLDIVTGAEMLIKKYHVNPRKIAITGGSYGGYMTLRALTKPEIFEFATGWALAAISDWEYMYDTSDAVFRAFITSLFGPIEESRSLLKEASPITDWQKVRKPLGIVQFANDTRTPLKPVWDFADKLIEKGHHVEIHVEPAMGHVNIPKGYLIRSVARQIQFFQKVMK
jgi:dipeptidyl aminopeptidase/acylaminoacyl peptidase